MICGTCVHSIIRVLWDGVMENEVIHCELDNVQVSRQMRKCSREKNPDTDYLKAKKIWDDEINPVLAVTRPEIVEPEPMPVVKKKPGNPNWVKRGT